MKTVSLGVAGMTCQHCRMAVTKAVQSVEGVEKAEVDLAAGKVTVSFDEAKASEEELLPQLKEAVAEAGYEVH